MTYVETLRRVVNEATPRLLALGDASADTRAPGAWSPRQIIGHLVDSASNNHQRFVRARFQQDLVFAGYTQDDWVEAGRYQTAPWEDLVGLWRTYNLQLARVMEATPEEIRLRERLRHNFDQIGFVRVPQGQPATLDHLMRDYVAHLEHHLRQIFPDV
jgi:DinB family protein